VDSGSITIPKSFMGMSHEWPHIEEIYNIPEYKEVIRLLNSFGGGPHIMRVGGGSTDLLTTVPGNEVWGPLTALYRETGTRYILGLNFEKGDLSLARRQMQAAIRGLPADAIVSFEIGNEVRCTPQPQLAAAACCFTRWLGAASGCFQQPLDLDGSCCVIVPVSMQGGGVTSHVAMPSLQTSVTGMASGRPVVQEG
jgi:hypothetical protein